MFVFTGNINWLLSFFNNGAKKNTDFFTIDQENTGEHNSNILLLSTFHCTESNPAGYAASVCLRLPGNGHEIVAPGPATGQNRVYPAPTGSGSQIHHSPGSRLHGGQRRDPSAWQNDLHLVPHNPGQDWEKRRVSFDEILPEPEKAKMIRIGLNPLVNQQTFWIRNLRVIYHP